MAMEIKGLEEELIFKMVGVVKLRVLLSLPPPCLVSYLVIPVVYLTLAPGWLSRLGQTYLHPSNFI